MLGLLTWVVPKAHGDRRWPVGDCQRVGNGAGTRGQSLQGTKGDLGSLVHILGMGT